MIEVQTVTGKSYRLLEEQESGSTPERTLRSLNPQGNQPGIWLQAENGWQVNLGHVVAWRDLNATMPEPPGAEELLRRELEERERLGR